MNNVYNRIMQNYLNEEKAYDLALVLIALSVPFLILRSHKKAKNLEHDLMGNTLYSDHILPFC